MRIAAVLVCVAILASGCGSGDDKAPAAGGPTYAKPGAGFCSTVTPSGWTSTERADDAFSVSTVSCSMTRDHSTFNLDLELQVSSAARTTKQYQSAVRKGAAGSFAGSSAKRSAPKGWWSSATSFSGIEAGQYVQDTTLTDGNLFVHVVAGAYNGQGTGAVNQAASDVLSAVHANLPLA